ncbi:MAG: hypothetical protein ABFS32_04075 [Bacteroidota bacterium]
MSRFIIILSMVLILVSCKTQKSIYSVVLTSDIKDKIGTPYSTVNNSGNEYVLAWNEDNSTGTTVVHFGVWEINTGDEIYQGTAIKGKVEWLNETALYLEDYKGIVENGVQIFKYKIDLLTKKKTTLHGKVDL